MSRRVVESSAGVVPGPAGPLEIAVDRNDEITNALAVICHPHPQMHGTMDNKVVTTLGRAFVHMGAVALRFNFRGVGGSAGTYDGGVGERDDALAVVAFARERWPDRPLFLGGFSFGAAVALAIAARAAPAGLVTVAPAIDRLPADFAPPDCPWLLVHGDADDVVPIEPVWSWLGTLRSPPRAARLEGAGHFFHGRLTDLQAVVTDYFSGLVPGAVEAS